MATRFLKPRKAAQLSYILYKIRSLLDWEVLHNLERYWKYSSMKKLTRNTIHRALSEQKRHMTGASASQCIDMFLKEADALGCCTAYGFIGRGQSGEDIAVLVGRESIIVMGISKYSRYHKIAE